jgi:nicotinamide mononucleotide (NMN) deamidase PncC
VGTGKAKTTRHLLSGDRDAIRTKTIRIALQGVIDLLNIEVPRK